LHQEHQNRIHIRGALQRLLEPRGYNLRFNTVFVALADLDGHTLADFYGKLFAQNPTVAISNVYTEFEVPGLRIGLFRPEAIAQVEFIQPSSGSVSLCIEIESLEEAIAHLGTLGYPPPGQIRHTGHGREIYAYDPQGNRLILHEGLTQPNLQPLNDRQP
jgi:hypothetical protein